MLCSLKEHKRTMRSERKRTWCPTLQNSQYTYKVWGGKLGRMGNYQGEVLCIGRAGNLIIGFPSKLLVFCMKMSKWAIRSKNERVTHSFFFSVRPERFAHNRSFPLSDLSKSLMVAHFWWVTWEIRSHRLFWVSNLSDSLTALTKKEGMRESLIFFIKKRI